MKWLIVIFKKIESWNINIPIKYKLTISNDSEIYK